MPPNPLRAQMLTHISNYQLERLEFMANKHNNAYFELKRLRKQAERELKLEMTVKLTPPLREAFEMAAMASTYRQELINHCGSVIGSKIYHDDWRKHPTPKHEWDIANTKAADRAFKSLLPSERPLMTAIVSFE